MRQKELEMKIIAHMVKSEEDLNSIIFEGIDEKFFIYKDKNKTHYIYRNLFNLIKSYYIKNEKLLTKEVLEIRINKAKNKKDYSEILSAYTQCIMQDVDTNVLPELIQELKENKMLYNIRYVMHSIESSVKSETPIETFENIKAIISDIDAEYSGVSEGIETSFVDKELSSVWDEYLDRKNNPEKYKGIEIGLSHIDEATNGFKKSTFNLVIGETGAGKSTILLNWAIEAYKRGNNILFFSFEMPLFQVNVRWLSREACIDQGRFLKGALTPEEEEILKYKIENEFGENGYLQSPEENYFKVITNFNNPGPSFVEAIIQQHKKTIGMPDAVFIDYLSNMRHPEVSKRSGQSWEHAGICAMELRNIAARNKIVIFSGQQTNRSGLEKGRKKIEETPEDYKIQIEDISESKAAPNYSDSIIGFTPDKENLAMYFHLIKGRDFHFNNFVANYYPNFSRIVDAETDSTYKQLSPLASRMNLNRRLSGDNDASVDIGEDL